MVFCLLGFHWHWRRVGSPFGGNDLLETFDAVRGEGRDALFANAMHPEAADLRERVDREIIIEKAVA